LWLQDCAEQPGRDSSVNVKLEALAESRAGSDKIREQVMALHYGWSIHGRHEEPVVVN